MDVFSIDYSQKPDNPSGGIIGFTGGNSIRTILLSLPGDEWLPCFSSGWCCKQGSTGTVIFLTD
jgi:hypothetical protein